MTVKYKVEDGIFIECEGKYYPGRPGRYYGQPEQCYESDPAEFDISESRLIVDDVSVRCPEEMVYKYYENILEEAGKHE